MSNLVVVAIPEEMDRVWKLSSEQVPHLTLLFLGEADNNPHVQDIVQFVEHAVTVSEHGPFYLDIDHRGTLGPDEADVLFFSKRSWNLKWIQNFRAQLLQDPNIKTAYDSTPQYEEWQPHLTMGYPTTPAKEMGENDHPLYSVCFDRIAVWDADYAGPEFRLEWPERELDGPLAVAYADQQKAAFVYHGMLEHHGVKGMKWGVRRDRQGRDRFSPKDHSVGGDIARAALFPTGANVPALIRLGKRYQAGKPARADKKWEKSQYTVKKHVQIHNTMADHFNARIGAINNKREFKNADFDQLGYSHPLTKKYYKEADKLTAEGYKIAIAKHMGTSPSGKKEAVLGNPEKFTAESGYEIHIRPKSAQHAQQDHIVLLFKHDAKGHILEMNKAEEAPVILPVLKQGEAFVEGLIHASVLDNPTLKDQITAKIKSILDDVTGDADGDINLFGDPLIQTKIRSVLQDFYQDPNVDNQVVYDALGEALSHHGILGMKWGVRRGKTPTAVAPKAKSVVPHGDRRKTKIEMSGGQNHPAHPDAIKVAESRAKLRKSGTKALSNHELAALAERVRLEKQATEADRHGASKWIRKFLGNQGNQAANQIVRTEIDSRIRSARR